MQELEFNQTIKKIIDGIEQQNPNLLKTEVKQSFKNLIVKADAYEIAALAKIEASEAMNFLAEIIKRSIEIAEKINN